MPVNSERVIAGEKLMIDEKSTNLSFFERALREGIFCNYS